MNRMMAASCFYEEKLFISFVLSVAYAIASTTVASLSSETDSTFAGSPRTQPDKNTITANQQINHCFLMSYCTSRH